MNTVNAYPDESDGVAARWVDLNGCRVRCIESGDSRATPVVLLPGWGCSAYSFRGNIGPLAAAGFRVVVVEPPGQGWSDKPRDPAAFTLPSLARSVLSVLDRLGIDAASFVGQSLGGAVAIQIALDAPSRAKRLSLWSTVGFGCARIVDLGSRLPTGAAPVLERIVGPMLVRQALRIVYGAGNPPSRRDVEQYALPIRTPSFVRSQIELLRNVRWRALPPEDIARLTLPVSIVTGSEDPIVPTACLADAAETLPDARLRIIAGAGHAANETHADEVNREAIAFLRVPDALATS